MLVHRIPSNTPRYALRRLMGTVLVPASDDGEPPLCVYRPPSFPAPAQWSACGVPPFYPCGGDELWKRS